MTLDLPRGSSKKRIWFRNWLLESVLCPLFWQTETDGRGNCFQPRQLKLLQCLALSRHIPKGNNDKYYTTMTKNTQPLSRAHVAKSVKDVQYLGKCVLLSVESQINLTCMFLACGRKPQKSSLLRKCWNKTHNLPVFAEPHNSLKAAFSCIRICIQRSSADVFTVTASQKTWEEYWITSIISLTHTTLFFCLCEDFYRHDALQKPLT